MTRAIQTLLLIEDFSPDRELYRRYLLSDSTYAYQFLEADSVTAGLELCRTHLIDAILLDYVLPDATGLEFLQWLHAQHNGDSPPVVMVTGEGDEVLAVRAMKLGAEDYLVKQRLTPELLQITMRSAIENAELRLQLKQSHERFRVSIENLLDCFGIYSAIRDESGQITDFRIDYLNTAALESNQMTLGDIGKRLCELLPSHRRTGLFEEYCQLVETGTPLVKEDWQYTDVFGTETLTRVYDVHVSKLNDGFVASWRDVTAGKEAENALRASEERWKLALQGNRDGIWDHDLRTNSAVVSDRFLEILGYSSEELNNFSQFLSYVHPDDVEKLEAAWQQHLRREIETYRCEYRVRCKNGSYKWVLARGRALWDDQGNPIRAVGSLTDITEAKQAEQRLQESEERLQLGVQVAEVALARIDYVSNTVTLSPEAARLYGIPADEFIVTRDCLHATFHPDERERLEQIIEQILDPAGSGWFALDHRVVWQTGEVRWLSVRKQVFFNRAGDKPRPDYAILAAIDITDRKRAEATLRQSEERYRSLSGLIPQLVWIANTEGVMLDVNERWSDFTGLTLEQAQIGGWQAIVHPDDISSLSAAWQLAQQKARHYQAEGRIRRADGVYRWHLHQAMPLTDEQGQIIKWFGTATDIHDLKQIEAERAQLLVEAQTARAEAEAANRSKDDFVAVVAHELRSPLNSIAGWAKLLQTRKFDEATQAKALDTIWRNTQAQVQLVEDLLDISRMARGTLQLTMAPVNLANVIEIAINLVLPQAQAKQIQIDTQLTLMPQVSGDFSRLQQVVVNLLTNAIKFTPEQGRVEIELNQVENQVQVRVSDTGKGIAPEFLPQIFERFKQGQKNQGSKDGLGLGLAIVKNLVELHRGTITAESTGMGQGSTFTVRLPLLETPAIHQTLNLEKIDATTLAGTRILIVDDEPDMLNLIRFVLQESGAAVEAVTTMADALNCLHPFKPDILISDIAMPEGNGYELVQQMRSYPEGDIPAIALTAYASATYEERSLQAGFQRHLSKPVEPEVLLATIISVISLRKSQ